MLSHKDVKIYPFVYVKIHPFQLLAHPAHVIVHIRPSSHAGCPEFQYQLCSELPESGKWFFALFSPAGAMGTAPPAHLLRAIGKPPPKV